LLACCGDGSKLEPFIIYKGEIGKTIDKKECQPNNNKLSRKCVMTM
jgi:hypothetical protein